jgi:hypothetical protein
LLIIFAILNLQEIDAISEKYVDTFLVYVQSDFLYKQKVLEFGSDSKVTVHASLRWRKQLVCVTLAALAVLTGAQGTRLILHLLL